MEYSGFTESYESSSFWRDLSGSLTSSVVSQSQCAVDVAAGLASAGMLPFVGTYCGFLTMRAGEQMRTFVGYTDLNVKFIGVNAGILGGEREGVTHQFYRGSGICNQHP